MPRRQRSRVSKLTVLSDCCLGPAAGACSSSSAERVGVSHWGGALQPLSPGVAGPVSRLVASAVTALKGSS